MKDMNNTKLNLSFAGCGFLGIYHVGVAACLKKYAPHLIVNKVSGASAGAIAAACLLCDAPLGQITNDVLKIATLARSKTLGPFSPSFNIQKILRDGLEKILPEDAHSKVNGKLHISLTRVCDRKNVIVSNFASRDELIQAILCSTFIPFFSGFIPPHFQGYRHMDGGFTNNVPSVDEHTLSVSPFCGESDICPMDETAHIFHGILCASFVPVFSGWLPPQLQGVRYIDGCYSDNLPILDENTITVSPFCGESDICPRDKTVNLLQVNLSNTSIELSRQNLYRFSRTLFPPQPEVLSKMCQQGFDDTLRFLARNDLIACDSCMTTEIPNSLGDELDKMASKNYEKILSEESCHQCKAHKQAALLDGLPEAVVEILQEAIESGNKGLFNWIFSRKGGSLLQLMSLPYIIPADMAYATALKLLDTAPLLSKNLATFSKAFIQLVAQTISRFNISSAKVTCQVAITEIQEDLDDPEYYPNTERRPSFRNTMNFGFSLNIDRESKSYDGVYRRRSYSALDMENERIGDDTFEHVLSVTSQQEAMMACYYLNNSTEVYSIDETKLSPSMTGHPYHSSSSNNGGGVTITELEV